MEKTNTNNNDPKTNPKYKDTVFTHLFSQKKYMLELYQALHPEDKATTEEDLEKVTLENILSIDMYNDLGFMAKDKFLILLEAQSTWSVNIAIRSFIYLALTYQKIINRNNLNVYGPTKVELPYPELFVVYTGEKQGLPDHISLSNEYFDSDSCPIEVRLKVVYNSDERNILSQYIAFCRITEEQKEIHRNKSDAIKAAIDACIARNILREYLETQRNEVARLMEYMICSLEQQQEMRDNENYEEGRKAERAIADKQLAEKDVAISEKDIAISEKNAIISEKDITISEKDAIISEQYAEIAALKQQLAEKDHSQGLN